MEKRLSLRIHNLSAEFLGGEIVHEGLLATLQDSSIPMTVKVGKFLRRVDAISTLRPLDGGFLPYNTGKHGDGIGFWHDL